MVRRLRSTVISSVGSRRRRRGACAGTPVGPGPGPGPAWCSCCGRCRRTWRTRPLRSRSRAAPRRVLARAAGPEVVPRHQDVGPAWWGWLSTKSRSSRHSAKSPAPSRCAPPASASPTDDLVRVDIAPVEGHTPAADHGDRLHAPTSSGWRSARRSPWPPPPPVTPGASGRPVPGVPRSCGSRWTRTAHGSELVGVHGEAHRAAGLAHSNPAFVKITSSPSASAWAFTLCEPGTTGPAGRCSCAGPRRPLPPHAVLDARVGARADEHRVDGDRTIGVPPSRPCSERRAAASRSPSSAKESG